MPLLTDWTHEVFSAAPHSALFPEKICVSGLTDGLVLSYDACAAGFPVVFSFHPDFRGLSVMKPGGLFFVVWLARLVAGGFLTWTQLPPQAGDGALGFDRTGLASPMSTSMVIPGGPCEPAHLD